MLDLNLFFASVAVKVLLLLSCGAIAFYCYAIYASYRFLRRPAPVDANFCPALSILKPICGCDEKTYENLASFCQQIYPRYQIIFGVQDLQDPSLEVIQQIIEDFPEVDIQFVITERILGTNRKVNNLASALTSARYDLLVLADADVKVGPGYLQQVVQPLKNPQVGVITCLYRSLSQGWVTAVEALGKATEFLPGVLVSNQLEGTKFAMGQTIVIRRPVLDHIGGFNAIANYLADDFQIGHLAARAGYQVLLSSYIVDHVCARDTVLNALQRQIRWMVGLRVSRTWGYAGLIFTYGTISSTLLVLLSGGTPLSWWVWGLTWLARILMGWVIGVYCLKDPMAKLLFWLAPFWDCLSFLLWCFGFFGNTFRWRGQWYRLTRYGELQALSVQTTASANPAPVKPGQTIP
jgi:ceramide glucosyltransferase